jgi:hypothetical protein
MAGGFWNDPSEGSDVKEGRRRVPDEESPEFVDGIEEDEFEFNAGAGISVGAGTKYSIRE